MVKNTMRKTVGTHRNHEQQLRSILLLGVAFIVVMLVAIGYRESNNRLLARVYAPMRVDQIPAVATQPAEAQEAGACCAEGECLDVNRSDCSGEGYSYWPNADVCLTACRVLR